MQITIDTTSSTERELRAAAQMLLALCGETASVQKARAVAHGVNPDHHIEPVVRPADLVQEGAVTNPPEVDAAPSEPTAPELDKRGMPYDERIHSAGRSLLANGNWKYKRGVDEALIKQVEAEHLGEQPVEESAAPTPPASLFADSPPPPPPAPAPTAPSGPVTYVELLHFIMENSLDFVKVNEACQKEDVRDFPSLGAQQDKVPAVAERLGFTR